MSNERIYNEKGQVIGWKKENGVLIWNNPDLVRNPDVRREESSIPRKKSRLDEEKCVSRLLFRKFR